MFVWKSLETRMLAVTLYMQYSATGLLQPFQNICYRTLNVLAKLSSEEQLKGMILPIRFCSDA